MNEGQELLRPGITRFATHIVALESLCYAKISSMNPWLMLMSWIEKDVLPHPNLPFTNMLPRGKRARVWQRRHHKAHKASNIGIAMS
ncbi:hypothetical protein CKAN_00432700 [Cinnamomum micranthum f. kanehirae]|uniref:Uncharacterized protein n=1 Tax=Cinnamomum micranthum f. kanehirae TaxID=337451 RepID=A0A3S3NAQ8_9MAGN|nr:hypothetical protein CKAN_00432700 [Cinnamomum micranthum f. kanehirae]